MRHPRATIAASLIAGLAVVTLAACGGGGGYGSTKTSTPAASSSSAPAASANPATSPTSSLGIRQLDLSKVPDVQSLIASNGGQYLQAGVIYADLTQDGVDEAIVPINSGGTMGDIGFLVLTPSGGGTKTLLKELPLASGGLSVAVVGGQLVMTQPIYGPQDPNCCPSALRKTTYVWNGTALAVQTVKTDVNPSGGGKVTPTP